MAEAQPEATVALADVIWAWVGKDAVPVTVGSSAAAEESRVPADCMAANSTGRAKPCRKRFWPWTL